MPCTPEYDKYGRMTKRDGCPENFHCTSLTWKKGGTRRVCLPEQPDDFYNVDSCETNFDCGYSYLEGVWSGCFDGYCVRIVE